MKVFISWSGEKSRRLAQAFRDWLPDVIHVVTPFMSAADIDKGARGLEIISRELKDTTFGIICVTPENRMEPWLLFEAGAISKTIEQSRVVPVLFDISYTEIAAPLRQFQASQIDKAEISRLVESLNDAMGDTGLSAEKLHKSFDKWWPDLEAEIGKIRAMAVSTTPGAVKLPPIGPDQSETLLKESIEIGRALMQMVRDMPIRLERRMDGISRGTRGNIHPGAIRDLVEITAYFSSLVGGPNILSDAQEEYSRAVRRLSSVTRYLRDRLPGIRDDDNLDKGDDKDIVS